jgi:hypothetical protein
MVKSRMNLMPAAAAAATLGLAGCLERRETITVDPDGTVTIEARFSTGSEAELYEGDAVPLPAGGWIVDESVEIDDDEQERFHLVAEALFPPEAQLPDNYAMPGDPDTDLYLQFPTTVTIEDRPDGVYYHFHRRYSGRGWARIEALRELLVDEKLKELEGTPLEEYTRRDHVLVLRSYADFEAAKMLTFARAAFLEVTPDSRVQGRARHRAYRAADGDRGRAGARRGPRGGRQAVGGAHAEAAAGRGARALRLRRPAAERFHAPLRAQPPVLRDHR